MIKYLEYTQKLPISLNTAWHFFSNPNNLNEITPEHMSFKILSTVPNQMYKGLLIQYKVRPFANIPMNWVTEITQIEIEKYFIDEQKFGPYKLWHHEHHFEEIDGGVMMTDKLYYDIGMTFIGEIAGKLYVHNAVKNIFDYRYDKLVQLFGKL